MRTTISVLAALMLVIGFAGCGTEDDPAAITDNDQATRDLSRFTIDEGVTPAEAEAALAILPAGAVDAAVAGAISETNGRFGVALEFESGVVCVYCPDRSTQDSEIIGFIADGSAFDSAGKNLDASLPRGTSPDVDAVVRLNAD